MKHALRSTRFTEVRVTTTLSAFLPFLNHSSSLPPTASFSHSGLMTAMDDACHFADRTINPHSVKHNLVS